MSTDIEDPNVRALLGQIEGLVERISKCEVERDELRSECARLRDERSDLRNWFEHRHVTGSLSLEDIDAMSPKDCANHAYEGKADDVDAIQSQLTDLRGVVAVKQAQIDGAQATIERLKGDLVEAGNVQAELRAQVERLHANGAVMRCALEKWKAYESADIASVGEGFTNMWFDTDNALSTSCGADLLARYRESVELLREQKRGICSIEWDGWNRRRDTLLAKVKGDL